MKRLALRITKTVLMVNESFFNQIFMIKTSQVGDMKKLEITNLVSYELHSEHPNGCHQLLQLDGCLRQLTQGWFYLSNFGSP
jgi:hypothetical protein